MMFCIYRCTSRHLVEMRGAWSCLLERKEFTRLCFICIGVKWQITIKSQTIRRTGKNWIKPHQIKSTLCMYAAPVHPNWLLKKAIFKKIIFLLLWFYKIGKEKWTNKWVNQMGCWHLVMSNKNVFNVALNVKWIRGSQRPGELIP